VEVTGQRDLLFKLRDLRNGPGRPETAISPHRPALRAR